jgi:hypothetical protein
MSAIELKKEIIEKLHPIEDVDFLEALKALIARRDKPNYLELDADLITELAMAKEDADHGNYITQEALDKKLDAWLGKK